jgi:hypothetical protein
MNDGKIVFATLVATPTKTSWSQAYTAGKLYAVLSLETEKDQTELAGIGKEIINVLVEEYFTLEEKNLDSVKHAVVQTTKKIPHDLSVSFVVVSLVNNIVYAYIFGSGKILLKRMDKVGSILSTPHQEETPVVHAVSGYIEDKDCLILETKQFSEIVSNDDFAPHYATPAEAVEMLSPKVHGTENGGASAIVLSYTHEGAIPTLAFATETIDEPHKTADEPKPEQQKQPEKQEEEEEEKEEPKRSALEEEFEQKKAHMQYEEDLPKRKRFFLSFPKIRFGFMIKLMLFILVPLIILGALAYTLYTTKQKQEDNKVQQLFDTVYPQAQKQYDEGAALLSLNKDLAKDDFVKAKKIIDDNINKFPQGSSQRQKMQDLADKVAQQGVGADTSSGSMLQASETSASNSPILAALIKNTKATYAVKNGSTVYLGSTTDIETATGNVTIKNDGDWKNIAGLGVFNSNIYILDKGGDQILKYLGGSKDSKSTYASGSFSNAVSMAIDSSIYVLSSDGSIKKYTRGAPDTFGITGLSTPFNGAIRIFTNADTDSVYVLDKGNSRVVALSKSGPFQASYAAAVIKQASDFDVDEKSKKLYILSSGKVYEITLP